MGYNKALVSQLLALPYSDKIFWWGNKLQVVYKLIIYTDYSLVINLI